MLRRSDEDGPRIVGEGVTPDTPSAQSVRDAAQASRILGLGRVRQVFRFLKAFAERQVPVRRTLAEQEWTMRLADLPDYPTIDLGVVEFATQSTTLGEDAPSSDKPLLRVGRPRITSAPPPPERLTPWLAVRWEDPAARLTVRESREIAVSKPNEAPRLERFDADEARVNEFANWRLKWEVWAEAERPARDALRVFERLYTLLGRIERDSERVELILGDGRLRRQVAAGSFDHPVLLQRVELEFDAGVPEFRVIDADRPPELYGAALSGEGGISGERLNALQQELELAGFHPLMREGTAGFLKRLVALLGPTAVYRETGQESVQDGAPTLVRDAALFLRQRPSGLPAAFERILEDLDHSPTLPTSLSRVVGIESGKEGEHTADDIAPWNEPLDVLLSKPANLEQVQIARALERHGAVLVQGPPGTGKSHTIANLIGHLVADGKRVLVTSHTTKALRVLREHIVEDLRPLCVALLEQDLEGRTQLEGAVRGIVERLTAAHEPQLTREIASLTTARADLIGAIAKLAGDLHVAREGEYVPIVPAAGDESVAPADAAREIGRNSDAHSWLPGPLRPAMPLPLSDDELRDLYRSNAELSPQEEDELAQQLPEQDALLTPEVFTEHTKALTTPESADLIRFWPRQALAEDADVIGLAMRRLTDLVEGLRPMVPWQRALIAAGRDGGAESEIWIALGDQVRDACAHYAAVRERLLTYDVELGDAPQSGETRAEVGRLIEHLAAGQSLGTLTLWMNPPWKALLKRCRVDGRAPSTKEHFEAIAAQLETAERRRTLAKRWDKQAAPIGLPAFSSIPDPPETVLRDYVEQFPLLLKWWTAMWSQLADAMHVAGFEWDAFRGLEVAKAAPATSFEREVGILTGPLTLALLARAAEVRKQAGIVALTNLDRALSNHTGVICATMRAAVRACDGLAYSNAFDALKSLAKKHSALVRRRDLLLRLGQCAPTWADAIRRRQGPHGQSTAPADSRQAWRWRQLDQELERRAVLDERHLTGRLEQRRTELRETTSRLIDRKAWLAQLRRTDLTARQALIGWADTQKKIGKGTGRRVPELQARARQQLAAARESVPVWIMPLARVAESFDPRKGGFDVVIVDEASQSDVTGLLAFYAGARVVVVGDHEQVSPLAVGQNIDDVKALIDQYLGGIPNAHLYDGQTSIYDLARQAFGGTIALREHFRCVPNIIEFSNHLSYGGQIRPLRDPATARQPHVSELVVPSSHTGGGASPRVNIEEAQWVAALMNAMVEMPDFRGKTLGAISLVGEEQAFEIQKLVLGLVGAVELQRRRFAAGNAAQFQGDERDVIILSMVDRPIGKALPLRENLTFKQRFNVAASRARDQMWLVHSLDPNRDLQPTDLRRRLIEHVRDPGAWRRGEETVTARAESPFERIIAERLLSAGFKVTPQVEVGRYRIDMVVSEGRQQVALECDGDRFHPAEQIPDDLARQAVLERAGWRFIRVRGTRFFRDPDATMRDVVDDLARMGVRPSASGPGALAPFADRSRDDEVRTEVIRRAAEILKAQGWSRDIINDAAML